MLAEYYPEITEDDVHNLERGHGLQFLPLVYVLAKVGVDMSDLLKEVSK